MVGLNGDCVQHVVGVDLDNQHLSQDSLGVKLVVGWYCDDGAHNNYDTDPKFVVANYDDSLAWYSGNWSRDNLDHNLAWDNHTDSFVGAVDNSCTVLVVVHIFGPLVREMVDTVAVGVGIH